TCPHPTRSAASTKRHSRPCRRRRASAAPSRGGGSGGGKLGARHSSGAIRFAAPQDARLRAKITSPEESRPQLFQLDLRRVDERAPTGALGAACGDEGDG